MNGHTSEALSREGQPSFLSGGGELGEHIRHFDWASTPLGAPEGWPQNLRMALRIMLTSRQPIWIGWGPELIFFYNDAYKSIIGGKHNWALGRPTAEVWREIWDDIGPMLATATSGDQGTYVEAQLLLMERNGYPEETYYTFSYSPIPNDDGSVGGIFCANSEDTQRVVGERQLALLRDLAAGATDARSWRDACDRCAGALRADARDLPFAMIYVADANGTNVHLAASSGIAPGHPAAPELISPDHPSHLPIGEVVSAQSAQVVRGWEQLTTGELPSGPWAQAPRDVAIIPIAPTGRTGRAGALVVGLNPFRLFDEHYHGFLGLVAGQIAAAIANAQAYEEERRRAEALAEIDRAKTTFFSNVSHEFRTPLTLMLAPIEDALSDASSAALPSVQRNRIETAHRNSLRLLKLVNSLLDFSRIEAGRVQARFQPVELGKITAELASNFESATRKAGLELRIDCPPLSQPVYVDLDMWEKIVLNLVSNAFKFTFDGAISVTLAPSLDRRSVELTVRDTGVGIPEAELPRLFERFHRVEGQKSRSFEGSGIGLALVQELVKNLGGTLGAESQVGEGAAFIVSVPLGSSHLPADRMDAEPARSTSMRADAYVDEALRWLPESASSETEAPARAEFEPEAIATGKTAGARILVVDDNADMRDYICRLLGARWEVASASDGLSALSAIRARKPDLVLTDVMMPGLDGFGLLRELRRDEGLRDLPVIVLSARAGEEARVEGLDAGADDYLTKPFAARELVARVNTNLELARIRRDATWELRESEARFRNMADHAPVMMWMTDVSGAFTYLNRRWSEFTAQTPEVALGFGAWEALHADDRAASRSDFVAANTARETFQAEYRLRRADGAYRWALSTAAPRFSDDGQFLGYIGSVIDITDRKAAEQILRQTNEELELRVASAVSERMAAEAQLRQSQKMEAVGKLTGGVAHDFNNVLQIIGGNLQLLSRDVAGNARAERRADAASAAVVRGSKLASQLLAFGRRQPLAPKVINLGRLIRGIDDMLRRALGEGVEIKTVIVGGLWNTFIDTVQVENALLNLAINARDAMGGQGKLTIEAGNAFLDDDYAARHVEVAKGQYVMLAVSDTGSGMSPDVLEQVFEPFFTTKVEGQGTGLGLSMVYGFVKQSGGHIKIYSKPGEGTTVRMYLPRARKQEEVEMAVEMGAATGGSETLLVVEDDDDVRATVIDMLSDLGYRILKAKDAQSALAIVESGIRIDLLFTDVVMPGPLRSPELARRARALMPSLAVLFTSGYTDNAIVHGGMLDEGVELLSKPYTRDALARKVRAVLLKTAGQAKPPQPSGGRVGFETARGQGLRVLLVEDEPFIRMTTADMLANLGHSVAEAADAEQALDLLGRSSFDVLMTDLSLPILTGEALAERAVSNHPELGIVFATGREAPAAEGRRGLAKAVMLSKPYDENGIAEALRKAAPAAGA